MVITPTNSGSLLAGAGLGFFAWGAFLKADKVPWLKVLLTTRRKDETLAWVNKNRGLSLLGLESVNYGIHGNSRSQQRVLCTRQHGRQPSVSLDISAISHCTCSKEAPTRCFERSRMSKLTLLAIVGLIYIGVVKLAYFMLSVFFILFFECRYGS